MHRGFPLTRHYGISVRKSGSQAAGSAIRSFPPAGRAADEAGNNRLRQSVSPENDRMKRFIIFAAALTALITASAQQPLYLVNGTPMERIDAIPPEDIESAEMLPADEETIARYGEKAADGVLLITLRYDRPAVFAADSTFGGYIARQVRWDDDEPAARVILRYKVTPEGRTEVVQELESTDNRLKRRVLKALSEAPAWQPARKNGAPVESEGVLRIQLPEGKALPKPVELVYR